MHDDTLTFTLPRATWDAVLAWIGVGATADHPMVQAALAAATQNVNAQPLLRDFLYAASTARAIRTRQGGRWGKIGV